MTLAVTWITSRPSSAQPNATSEALRGLNSRKKLPRFTVKAALNEPRLCTFRPRPQSNSLGNPDRRVRSRNALSGRCNRRPVAGHFVQSGHLRAGTSHFAKRFCKIHELNPSREPISDICVTSLQASNLRIDNRAPGSPRYAPITSLNRMRSCLSGSFDPCDPQPQTTR
jgi:hypothetical protein